MPIYEYRCASCGAELEKLQKISDPPLLECPECGKDTLVKLVSASSFRLKGSGWYETDFKTGKKKNGAGEAAGEGAGSAEGGATEASKAAKVGSSSAAEGAGKGADSDKGGAAANKDSTKESKKEAAKNAGSSGTGTKVQPAPKA